MHYTAVASVRAGPIDGNNFHSQQLSTFVFRRVASTSGVFNGKDKAACY
jgi:hypothetical protein